MLFCVSMIEYYNTNVQPALRVKNPKLAELNKQYKQIYHCEDMIGICKPSHARHCEVRSNLR
jgi:hypothetical protein